MRAQGVMSPRGGATPISAEQKTILEKQEALKKLLGIKPQQRQAAVLEAIADGIKDVEFFLKYHNTPEYEEICRYLYIKSFDPRQYIFKQGDIGDAFYIILSGGVTIFIDEPTEYKNFMQLKEVGRLKKGAAFGEVALITNSKRTATIMANEPTDLIILEKEIFQQFVKEKKNLHLQKVTAFLENLKLDTLFKSCNMMEIATKCSVKKYPSNTIIIRQGDDASALYFVRKGCIQAIKYVPFRYDPQTKAKIPFDISDPPEDFQLNENYENDEKPYYKNDFLEIDEFCDGDMFGEQSVFTGEPIEFSAISQCPSEVIYISVFDLNKLIPVENFELFKASLKQYPSNQDTRQIFWERKHWGQFRSQMIANVAVEKEHKRGFMNNLRSSVAKYSDHLIPFGMTDIQIHDNRLYFNLMDQAKVRSNDLKPGKEPWIQRSLASDEIKFKLNPKDEAKKISHRYTSSVQHPSLKGGRYNHDAKNIQKKESQLSGSSSFLPKITSVNRKQSTSSIQSHQSMDSLSLIKLRNQNKMSNRSSVQLSHKSRSVMNVPDE